MSLSIDRTYVVGRSLPGRYRQSLNCSLQQTMIETFQRQLLITMTRRSQRPISLLLGPRQCKPPPSTELHSRLSV